MPSRPRGEHARRALRLFVLILLLACAAPAHAQKPYAQQKLNEALALLQEKQDLQAIPPLEEAIKAEPGWSSPRIVLAKVRFGLTQYPQAIQQMEAVLLKPLPFDPKEAANYWTLLGKYRYIDQMTRPEGNRKFDDAVKAFDKAIAIDKKSHEANYYLARIALAKGDLGKAADAIKAALDGRPGDPGYRTLQADIFYQQGKVDEASAEVNEVLSKLSGQEESKEYREAKELANKINADLSARRWKKIAMIGGPILLVVLIGGVAFMSMRSKKTRSVMLDGADIGGDASSYEEICATALRRLSTLTQMAHGAMYIASLDGDEMQPKATLALEPDEVKPIAVDLNELPRWIERNDGKPFLFKAEKKEGTFIKAFPDAREQMEPLQIRIGVPFIFQERMLGIAFIGIEDTKDMLRFKKLYDRSQGDIYRIAVEYAAALYRLYEDELAYIDVLTKFKSRRYVEENLPRALVDAEDAERKGAVVMFEFDQFRGLQEQYGDSQAESVLKTVAGEIKLAIPPEDGMVARFEGGKFFAFCPVASADEAYKFAERIQQRVTDTRISRNFAPPTASVGLAVFPDHGKKADDLIWAADRVMMGINAGGGNAIGTADGSAPDKTASGEHAAAAPSAPPAAADAPRPPFMPGRPAPDAAAPGKPFMTGAPAAPPPVPGMPPPLPTPPAAAPPLPTAPGAPPPLPAAGARPAFGAGAPAPPAGGGLLRGPGTPGAPPPPPPPPKVAGIPGFAGGGSVPAAAAAPATPPPPPPLPPKAGGIPGFSGGGAPPSSTPPVGGPPPAAGAPRTGAPPMTPRPPAPTPPGTPEKSPSAVPGFGGAPKASSTGLTKKVGAKTDTGGLTPKATSFPGAARSGGEGPAKPTFPGAGRPEGKPLFPTTPARPTLPSTPASPEAETPDVETPAASAPPPAASAPPPAAASPAARSPFPGAAPLKPPGFPGAPPAVPGAARPAAAGGPGIPGFGGRAKPPVDLDAPTIRNPIGGDAPAAGPPAPGFGARPKGPVDLDAPTVRNPVMGDAAPAAAEAGPAAGAGIPGFGGRAKAVDLDAPTIRNPIAGDAAPPADGAKPAGGAGIPGFGGRSKAVDLDAPTIRNPIGGPPAEGAKPAGGAGIPGFGGRAKPSVDLDAPTVRGPLMGDAPAAAPPEAPAARAPIDGPTVPWGKPGAPSAGGGVPWSATAPPAPTQDSPVPWGKPSAPPPPREEPPDESDAPALPSSPSAPPWVQAEVDQGDAPAASPSTGGTAPRGLLGAKGPARPAAAPGKLFRRMSEEPAEAKAAPAAAAGAPPPYEIRPADRDGAGFVGSDVLAAALQREIERADAMQDHCSVLYFQLDRQAEIAGQVGPDRLGAIKNEIASLVNDFLKEGTDIPGHWQEGFVIVLPRTSARIATNLAEQIRFTVSNLSFPGIQGNSTLSIGIAGTEHSKETPTLLQSAREAAAQAETGGGNAIQVYGG